MSGKETVGCLNADKYSCWVFKALCYICKVWNHAYQLRVPDEQCHDVYKNMVTMVLLSCLSQIKEQHQVD